MAQAAAGGASPGRLPAETAVAAPLGSGRAGNARHRQSREGELVAVANTAGD